MKFWNAGKVDETEYPKARRPYRKVYKKVRTINARTL